MGTILPEYIMQIGEVDLDGGGGGDLGWYSFRTLKEALESIASDEFACAGIHISSIPCEITMPQDKGCPDTEDCQ